MTDATHRLDKWLWYARFFKSRSLATQRCRAGKVRVNKARVNKPNHQIHVGDVLTFATGPRIRIIEVRELGQRRGPAAEAQTLYADLAPATEGKAPLDKSKTVRAGVRDPGSGRPTKRERRLLERWQNTR